MSVALAVPTSVELSSAINDQHAEVLRHATGMVGHAIKCGSLLIEAKATVVHGEWTPWLESNFHGSPWVAQKYMQLARAELANPGSITEMDSIGAALKAVATPRARVELPPAPALDPDSPGARLLAATKGLDRGEPAYIDAESIEIAPSGIEERRWNTTLRRCDEVRSRMSEAVNPGLTSEAAAQALQEASIAARQTAIDLEHMASLARRR